MVTILSSGGVSTPSSFPRDISPHQPFLGVESMRWERDGGEFSLNFRGDVFETEDQRNWTDASFKTYSTPLARPFPVDVRKGERVHQSVVLTASAPAGQRMSAASSVAADTPRILDIQTYLTLSQGKTVEIQVEPCSVNTTNMQKDVPNE